MKPINLLLTASVMLVFSSIIPAGAAPVTDRTQIQAALDLMNKGLIDRDVKELLSSYAPDCTGRSTDGQVITHKQLIEDAPKIFANITFISAKTTILTFSVKGGKAYVTSKDHDVIKAVNPQTQQPVTVFVDDSDSEVWRKIDGKWKQELSQETSEHFQPQNSTAGPAGVGA